MAQRFGGKFSPGPQAGAPAPRPGGPGQFDRAEVNPVGARANVLFVPAVVLVFATIWKGAVATALGLGGAAVLTLGAYLLRGGLEAEAEYHARRSARRPSIPRKIFAAILAATGIGMAALAHGNGVLSAILYALATGGLHLAAFGIDPLGDKGMEGVDTFQQDRVARVVDEAEKHLAAMKDALRRARDRHADAQLERFSASVRDMVRTVEEDPRDLTAARKYLGVYLMGARDAAAKFADLNARSPNPEAQGKFIALLEDLEQNFAAKTRKLMADTQTDLDVEIDVLRDRLAREGVTLDQ